MKLPVEPLKTIVCDYAAEQRDGKFTFSGVFAEDVETDAFGEGAIFRLYVCIFVRPLESSGEILMELKTPNRKYGVTVHFRGPEGKEPTERDRIIFAFPVTIEGPTLGLHEVRIGTEKSDLRTIHEFHLLGPSSERGPEQNGFSA